MSSGPRQSRDDKTPRKIAKRWFELTFVEVVVVTLIVTLLIGVLFPTHGIGPHVAWYEFQLPFLLIGPCLVLGTFCFAKRWWKAGLILMCIGATSAIMLVRYSYIESAWQSQRIFRIETRYGAGWIRHEGLVPCVSWNDKWKWDSERIQRATEGTPLELSERSRPDRESLPSSLPQGWRRLHDFVVSEEAPQTNDLPKIVVGYSVSHKRDGIRLIMFSDGKDDWLKPTDVLVDQWNVDRAAVGLSPIPGLP